MNFGLKPGATPAETYALLTEVQAAFLAAAAAGATRVSEPTRDSHTAEQLAAWRTGWVAGSDASAYLSATDEHSQQCALFDWLRACEPACPELELAFAVPNGGLRSKAVAGKLKAEGTKAGVPDVVLPLPAGGMGALYIEMKSKNGGLNQAQKERIPRLCAAGNSVVMCRTWDEAADAVLVHMAARWGFLGCSAP
jgi:hypothetical protein